MSDNDIDKILEDLFRSEHAPPLTDSVVDAFLATPSECSQEAVDRIRTRFAEKALADLHKEPIKFVKDQLPFGRWIEVIRHKARLTREDIGIAIRKDVSYVEAIETGTITPWSLNVPDIIKLISLFRLHIKAFSELLSISFAVSQRKTKIGIAPRKSHRKGSKTENEVISRVLDEHLASSVTRDGANTEIDDCLAQVRDELRRSKITDLLD